MKLDRNSCIEQFSRYEKKTEHYSRSGKKIGTSSQIIDGIESDKKGYIHESSDDYGNFEDKPIKIPTGYKKKTGLKTKKLLRNIAENFYCKTPKSKKEKQILSKKVKGALEWSKWEDKSKKYWLTIKDIERLKNGDKLVVLPLHRNVLDIPFDTHKKNTSYRPERVFKSEKDTYVYHGDLNVISKVYNDKDTEPWGLDVEYKKDYFYPLIDGYLPAKDPQKLSKLLGKKTHWTKFPKKTHVGWRGPMILWSDLKKLPKLYFTDDY